MKALKVFEKFTEDSDPIHDLGIGSKFAKIQKGDIIKPKKDLRIINHDIVFDSSLERNMPSSCYAVISDIEKLENNLKLTLIFVNSLNYAITARKYYEKGIYMLTYGKADIETWEKYFKVVYQNNKLTERFTEDSDPIHDLGIGAKYKNFQNANEMHEYIVSILPKILHKRKIPKDILNQFGHYIREKYHVKIDEYVNKYFTINNSKINYKEDFLFSKLLDHNQSLYINEKFTENDSDPVHDLGIGPEFTKIQEGDIIKPKKDIRINNRILIFDDNLTKNLNSNCYAVVRNVEKLHNNLKLTLIFITSFNSALITRKYYKQTVYTYTYGEADIETWEKYFKVVYQNNKLIEKFSEKSDPIKDLGIGSISFAEKASETINNKKDAKGLHNWLEYLKSLIGKKITGKFAYPYQTEEKSFVIKNYKSFWCGERIYFIDENKVSYQVDNDNRYYIS